MKFRGSRFYSKRGWWDPLLSGVGWFDRRISKSVPLPALPVTPPAAVSLHGPSFGTSRNLKGTFNRKILYRPRES